MTNQSVTVLMPVYDPPLHMLLRAIESVVTQTIGEFEFLILDDGSLDEQIRAELDRWVAKDSRVRLYHEPHRGVQGTLNRGLEIARGAFIARQDADDWSEPERLERQVAVFRECPEVALVSTDTYSHTSDGKPLWKLRLPHSPRELERALWFGNPFVHGSTMYRRANALAVGGYRRELAGSADYDFLWRLTETGDAVNLPEVLYHYRYASGSISARRAEDQARSYRAVKLLARARQRGELEDIPAAIGAAELRLDTIRAALKQADHFMLAGDFEGARRAYTRLLFEDPSSGLAWAKMIRLAVFWAFPWAREACFRRTIPLHSRMDRHHPEWNEIYTGV